MSVINSPIDISVVDMEAARDLHLSFQAELREHRHPRAVILEPLFAEVMDLVDEDDGDGLSWSVFCESGLLGSLVEMADV